MRAAIVEKRPMPHGTVALKSNTAALYDWIGA
ncbi:MAG: hypothetical protein K0Q83_1300 [Deltaproteobacteria bacterium]|jgi:hypothetical protein|nr:hypothetical protein [Deltaproteobacteria bacterium]